MIGHIPEVDSIAEVGDYTVLDRISSPVHHGNAVIRIYCDIIAIDRMPVAIKDHVTLAHDQNDAASSMVGYVCCECHHIILPTLQFLSTIFA